jgi:hypothetical protein
VTAEPERLAIASPSTCILDFRRIATMAAGPTAAETAFGPGSIQGDPAADDDFNRSVAALVARTQDELDRQYEAAHSASQQRIPTSEMAALIAA